MKTVFNVLMLVNAGVLSIMGLAVIAGVDVSWNTAAVLVLFGSAAGWLSGIER